jgi:hypothetical protein
VMCRPRPAPTRDYLLVTPLYKIVRDFPETLTVLRGSSVDPRVHGGSSLSRADGWEPLLSLLMAATSWRPAA